MQFLKNLYLNPTLSMADSYSWLLMLHIAMPFNFVYVFFPTNIILCMIHMRECFTSHCHTASISQQKNNKKGKYHKNINKLASVWQGLMFCHNCDERWIKFMKLSVTWNRQHLITNFMNKIAKLITQNGESKQIH